MGLNNFSGSNTNDKGNQGNQGGVTPPVVMQSNGVSVADEFLINYNERFKTAGTILFRESITKQLTGVLIGKNKPNAILVVPPAPARPKSWKTLPTDWKTTTRPFRISSWAAKSTNFR